jgi:hypothetical protein
MRSAGSAVLAGGWCGREHHGPGCWFRELRSVMTSLRDVKDFKDLVNVPNLNEQVIDDFRANGLSLLTETVITCWADASAKHNNGAG